MIKGVNFFYVKQVLSFLNDIFDTLLKALSDPSDEVILCIWFMPEVIDHIAHIWYPTL
jgi:ABC-type thiamin/hydroxymethylpyrimidine transport system permease subunit